MKKLITILLLYLTASSGSAQVVFEHLTKNQGLPNNNITCISQDRQGFMWFGSYNGLIRYDGNDFRYFNMDQKFPYNIRYNQVRDLYVDAKGLLYVAFNHHGFAIYDPISANFTYFSQPEESSANGLTSNKVLSISPASGGKMWISTKSGLDLFDPVSQTFEHFLFRDKKNKPTASCGVSSVTDNGQGEIWIYTLKNDLIRYNQNEDEFTYFHLPSDVKATHLLNKGGVIFKDSRGYIWLGTEHSGLYRLNPQTGSFTSFTHTSYNRPYKVVMDIIEDEEGTIWVATDGDGIVLYSYDQHTYREIIHDPGNSSSINTNAVYSFYYSEPGIIWTGTYAGGVNICKKKKRKFYSYSDVGPDGQRLSHKSVLSLIEGEDGNILLGTDGGGLSIFNPREKGFTYKSVETAYCFNIVKSLLKDSDGNVWAGSYGEGACVTDTTGRQMHIQASLEKDSGYLNHPSVWAMKEAPDGKIWIGLLENGIDIFDPKTGNFDHLSPDVLGFTPGNIYSILRDSQGRMWMATEESCLLLFDHQTRKVTRFNPSNTPGFTSIYANVVVEDSQGNIWVGFENGGLCKLDVEEKKAINISFEDGLPGASVHSIEEDHKGIIWVGTDNGLASYDPVTGQIRTFSIEDGLRGMEYNKGASLKDKNGYLYFGSGDGFIYFHPDSIWYNIHSPATFLTSVKINNQEITSLNENHYIDRNIPFADQITLSHRDYIVSFEFSSLDYLIPEKTRYAYMLEGFDKDWVYAGADRRFATYTTLPPGKYNFLVKAANNDGLWNEIPTKITVTVLPPWWNTAWFKSLTFFAVTALIAGVMYFRIRMEKNQRLLLEKLVKERTLQLNQSNATKDKLFSIIAHDLKGPVNSMKGLSSMLASHYEKMQEKDIKEAIGYITKASGSLSELVNNLFSWARLHTKNLKPEKQLFDLAPVIERIVEVYSVQAVNKGISICYKRPAINALVYADPNMFETVIRNLVNNAVKFTDKGGMISITCEQKKGFTSTFVKDTGKGMEQKKVDKLFNATQSTSGTQGESGTGLGLTICHDFVKANEGTINVRSKIGEGTEFEVRFRNEEE